MFLTAAFLGSPKSLYVPVALQAAPYDLPKSLIFMSPEKSVASAKMSFEMVKVIFKKITLKIF